MIRFPVILALGFSFTLGSCFFSEAKEDVEEAAENAQTLNEKLREAEKTAEGLLNDPELRSEALARLKTLVPDSISVASNFAEESESFDFKEELLSTVMEFGEEIPSSIEGMKHCLQGLPKLLRNKLNPKCYGPPLAYNGALHPDLNAAGPVGPQGCTENCELPPFDLGIWEEKEGENACAAAKMNQLVGNASYYSDLASGSLAMMVCVAGFYGDSIPEASKLVLTEKIQQIVNEKVEVAEVKKVDGNYHTHFKGTLKGVEIEIDAKHNAMSKTGRLWVKTKKEAENGEDMREMPFNLRTVSMQYKSTEEGRLVRVASAAYTPRNPEMDPEKMWEESLTATGELKVDPVDWTDDLHLMTMRLAPEKYDVSYGWQAGNGDGFLRVFNASAEKEKATAWYGYAPHNVGENDFFLKLLTIDRMICNWAGPGGVREGQPLVQKQEMEMVSKGLWKPTVSNIHYIPTNSCNINGDPGVVFPSMAGEGATHELTPLNEYKKEKLVPLL